MKIACLVLLLATLLPAVSIAYGNEDVENDERILGGLSSGSVLKKIPYGHSSGKSGSSLYGTSGSGSISGSGSYYPSSGSHPYYGSGSSSSMFDFSKVFTFVYEYDKQWILYEKTTTAWCTKYCLFACKSIKYKGEVWSSGKSSSGSSSGHFDSSSSDSLSSSSGYSSVSGSSESSSSYYPFHHSGYGGHKFDQADCEADCNSECNDFYEDTWFGGMTDEDKFKSYKMLKMYH